MPLSLFMIKGVIARVKFNAILSSSETKTGNGLCVQLMRSVAGGCQWHVSFNGIHDKVNVFFRMQKADKLHCTGGSELVGYTG